MSFTQIINLPEKQLEDILPEEVVLLSGQKASFKIPILSLEQYFSTALQTTAQDIQNKIIDDITNYVTANRIHYSARAVELIPRGTPVALVPTPNDEEHIYVGIAGAGDIAIGIAEETMPLGTNAGIMISGLLDNFDTTSWNEGDLLYTTEAGMTNVQPTTGKIQFIGFVLNKSVNGQILVNGSDPYPDAKQILFNNSGTTLDSNDVQGALVELAGGAISSSFYKDSIAPTPEFDGVTEGDVWLDTGVDAGLKFYREYPALSGNYQWDALQFRDNSIVDGGSW